MVPNPELLAICRLVFLGHPVGEDVDDFAPGVDVVRLLCFVSIADGSWKKIGERMVLHGSLMMKGRFGTCP